MKRLAALWIAATLSLAANARPDQLLAVYQGNRPPFSFRDAQGHVVGIEADVVTEALRRAGHRVAFLETPNVRLLPFRDGEGVDLAVSVRGSDGRGVYFSDEFVTFENVAISRRDRHVVLKSITDLDRYTFAIWQNGWRDLGPVFEARYQPSADGRFPPNYFQPTNQQAQNKMFWYGRVDVIVVDKQVFEWYRKQFSAEFNTAVELDQHAIFDPVTGFKVAFRDRDLRDAFNRALRAMHKDHSYERIIERYALPSRQSSARPRPARRRSIAPARVYSNATPAFLTPISMQTVLERHSVQQNISFLTSNQFIEFQQLKSTARALMRGFTTDVVPVRSGVFSSPRSRRR